MLHLHGLGEIALGAALDSAVAGDSRPLTDGRLLLVLDDSINPKTGTKVFACQTSFDHAAKTNQSHYPWAKTIVTVGRFP